MSEANSVCALNVSHSYQAVQSSAKHLLEFTSTEELLGFPDASELQLLRGITSHVC